jgi:sigma-E factor negative regulatory protein RseB
MTRSGDWWITAMGDVPMATVQLFSAALERRR